MKKIIVIIIVIAAVAGGYYYYNLNNTAISTTSYEYIKIEKGNIKKTVSATGKIIPPSTLTLSSEISGKIIYFSLQLLISLIFFLFFSLLSQPPHEIYKNQF